MTSHRRIATVIDGVPAMPTLESPCKFGTTRVATESENTHRGSSGSTRPASPGVFDIPPPSTTTSGSQTLITVASDFAGRFS
jgi:hypothetical protein